jgi:ketosteroid isomerase-like protein
MSDENLEIVRGIFDEWGRGNFRAGTERFDPYSTLVLRPELPEAGGHHGPEAIRAYMERFLGAWEKVVIKGEEFIAAGDSVFVAVHQVATGKGSGATVEMRYFQLWTLRGGVVLRVESIPERSDALEAAGLSE